MTNNQRLKVIMSRNRYTARHVAELINVDPVTVGRWRVDPDKPSYRPMPDNLLELLELKQDIKT